jgi:hypothetical protein
VNNLSETKNPSPNLGKNSAGWVWQIVVGLVLFVLAAIISLVEIVSQTRKYKKVTIPIEN